MTTKRIEMPPKLIPVLSPSLGTYRYRVMRGGRGSGKSYNAAKMAAIFGAVSKLRILCTREYQNSIKESFHAELKSAITSDEWLSSVYDVGVDYLRHKFNGTEFIFKGLRSNISSVKSMAQIDLVIVEEAETVPHASWQDLIPTIRAPKSEFWVIYNPKRRDSWVAKQFDGDTLPPRTIVVDVNHDDNPWFSPELDEQRKHDEIVMDPALYNHVWRGAYYEQSQAQIFSGKYRVAEFDPKEDWDGPYFGLDWGFSQDPTAATKSWIHKNKLYIECEYGRVGMELDDTARELIENMPDIERHVVRADSARPESISYVKRGGSSGQYKIPRIEGVKKGSGSVEDGIQFMRSFDEVIIHPRCKEVQKEFSLYSYKVDRLSGDVLTDIVDANNHYIDSIRYALEPMIRSDSYSWDAFR